MRAHLTGDQSNFFVLPSNSLHTPAARVKPFNVTLLRKSACVWGAQCGVSEAVGYTSQGACPVVQRRNQPWKRLKDDMPAHTKPRLHRRGAAHSMTAAPEHVLNARCQPVHSTKHPAYTLSGVRVSARPVLAPKHGGKAPKLERLPDP